METSQQEFATVVPSQKHARPIDQDDDEDSEKYSDDTDVD